MDAHSEETTILIVDDDPSILRMSRRVLGKTYTVLDAATTGDALKLILERHPRLILLDIHISEGDMDGIACLQAIRKAGFRGIICMYTGDASPSLLFQAAVEGADDYIVKGPSCDLSREVAAILEYKTTDSPPPEFTEAAITTSAFLRSRGLGPAQAKILEEFAKQGYPRIKEFANQLGISETSLWKRLSRIREKLEMDSMTQITHLLTMLTILEQRNRNP